jgi:hypothetical protein
MRRDRPRLFFFALVVDAGEQVLALQHADAVRGAGEPDLEPGFAREEHLSPGSIDSTSGPTAATIACRVCAPSLIGTISPLAVSESSSGSTTIQSSSGSSTTSRVVSSNTPSV